MPTIKLNIPDEEAMRALGQDIALALKEEKTGGCIFYLYGDLGAGKTTLTRAILQGLGVTGRIKSPTYTIVEPYELNGFFNKKEAYHFDLYRLGDPEELEYLGIRDYFSPEAVVMVEWPEKGEGVLPSADVCIRIQYAERGRVIELEPVTARAGWLLSSGQFSVF